MHLQLIASGSYSANGTIDKALDTVEGRLGSLVRYVKGLFFKVDVVLTSASTSDAIAQAQFAGALKNLQVHLLDGTTLFAQPMNLAAFQEMFRYLLRRGTGAPAAISANSNTTNTFTMNFYIPYVFRWLWDKKAFTFPASFLARLQGTWPSSTLFGTGQTITSIGYELYVDTIPEEGLSARARLQYGALPPTQFVDGRVPIDGRLLFGGVVDDAAGASTTIGATDFTHIEAHGRGIDLERIDVDIPAELAAVAFVTGSTDIPAVPSAGTSRIFPWYFPYGATDGEVKLSDLPVLGQPRLTLATGAGNPALTDQKLCHAVARPVDEASFASNVGLARDIEGTAGMCAAGLQAATAAHGRKGLIDKKRHPLGPFLERRVPMSSMRAAGR